MHCPRSGKPLCSLCGPEGCSSRRRRIRPVQRRGSVTVSASGRACSRRRRCPGVPGRRRSTIADPSPVLPAAAGPGRIAPGEALEQSSLQGRVDSLAVVGDRDDQRVASAWTRAVTVVPGGVRVRALVSRLPTTWCNRSASPVTSTGSSGTSSAHRCSGPAACASATASTTTCATSTYRQIERDCRERPAWPATACRRRGRTSARDADSTRSIAWVISAGSSARERSRELGVPTDGRQRCAQLVARVGDELPHLGLAGLTCGQRITDVIEQAVQGGPDGPHLRGRVRCPTVRHARPARPRPDRAATRRRAWRSRRSG